jgi:hypothetical protein
MRVGWVWVEREIERRSKSSWSGWANDVKESAAIA